MLFHGLELDVTCTPGDPGVRTYPNGDPGYPGTAAELESVDRVAVDDESEAGEWLYDNDAPGVSLIWNVEDGFYGVVLYDDAKLTKWLEKKWANDIADAWDEERAK